MFNANFGLTAYNASHAAEWFHPEWFFIPLIQATMKFLIDWKNLGIW